MKKTLLLASVALLPVGASASDLANVEKMVVIGSTEGARSLPGSGSVVTPEQLETEVSTDINQALKTVPGIYIREEDGLGLRPNIGIRAASSERSGKVTLMEDGVLIAPAPYSNPQAYYFPTALRMSMFEVLKGAPLLRHGPQTTGGVVNMLSTPIPEEMSGSVLLTADERGSTDVHAYYGGKKGEWSFLLETVQRNGDGFKDIDNSDQDPEYDISDYVVKLGWEGERQSVLLKLQSSEEVSNETYLGLTDDDFSDDPNRRYGLSSIDEMDNDHQGVNLTHVFEWSDNVTSTATVYRNEFARDWFKLSGGGSLVESANAGDINSQGILDGTVDVRKADLTAGESEADFPLLKYKHNSREYVSEGVQLNFDIVSGDHQIAVGVRSHHDEMDRFQPEESYQQLDGSLVYESTKAPTGSNNREEEADATSVWLTDSWQVSDALNVNLALRYEDVKSSRKQYSNEDRSVATSSDLSERENDTSIWLPGVSFTYDLNDQVQLLAGLHKGFSPLGGGAEENQDPEESKNWEAGFRFDNDIVFLEAIGFYSELTDTTENCSNGSPCSNNTTSGSFVLGKSVVKGVELQVSTNLDVGSFNVPVDTAFTYTTAEIIEDNVSSGLESGDELKDIPRRVISVRAGLEHDSGWNNYMVAKYIDEMCSEAGCNRTDGEFEETESLVVVDFISRYQLKEDVEVFLKTENLFDQQQIVSRAPDGARPNKPRTTLVGVKYDF